MTYIPKFESQTDQRAPLPWTNCLFASGAMFIDGWTYGRMDTDDITLRRLSGIDPSLGINFRQLSAAIAKYAPQLGNLRFSEADGGGTAQATWASVRKHLAGSGAIMAVGPFARLRLHKSIDGKSLVRWQPNGEFIHGVYVTDYRTSDNTVWWMDPLGNSGYIGERVPLIALWEFLNKKGNDENAVVTVGHSFTTPRPAPSQPDVVTGGWAGRPSAFGTRYPPYVHTDKEALAWVNRNIMRYREAQTPLPRL